ncbi:MAG: PAS domain S-box protein, partial [Bacteroidia bacterium]|nr:PAS domain S-box protein [Bacteroidia bacterium]
MIKKTKNKIPSSKSVATSKFSNASDDALISALQNLPVSVIIFSLSNILFANKSALKILKPSTSLRKSITKYSIFDFLLPEYHQRIKENSLKIIKGEEFIPFELKIKNAKNQIIDLEVKSNAIFFKGQKVIQTIFTDISDQVKYRDELFEAKQNLELITKNANDLIYFYTYQPKPKYLYVSASFKKILGYSPQEFYKNSHFGASLVVDKRGYKSFEASVNKKQKSNSLKHTSATFQYRTKSGKLIWLEDNFSPIYDEKGKIKFILGISRDITKEKNAQIELEQKWNNYKNLLDTSPIGIFIHEGYCIYSNKTAANILEVNDPKKLNGKNLIEFIIPEQRQRAVDRMQRAKNGEELSDLLYSIKTVKGKTIDVELKTVPFVYNGKQVVQTTITNVSAEKKLSKEKLRAEIAEEANKKLKQEIEYRQKIQHELVIQTTKYEAIFNNTSHLIWSVDKKLRVTSFNKNYFNYIKKIYAYDLKVGDHISNVKTKTNQNINLNFWINKYKKVFKEKKDNTVEFFEVQNQDDQGKMYYREIYLHPIRNSRGEISEIAIIAHDVTERRLSEQKIIEQSAKLQAIFESGKQLIWTVDRNYFFTSFNQNFSDSMFNIYKVRPTLENKIYKPQTTKKGKEYHNWWIEKYNEVFK